MSENLRDVGNPIRINVYNEVIIPPTSSIDDHFGFTVGAYTLSGQPITDFRIHRIGGDVTVEPDLPTEYSRVDVPSTYGGLIDYHFGHFMLETLTRQWWLRRVTSGPIIWHRQIPLDIQPWQVEIFSLCGIDVGRFLYVTEPLLVKEISVPEPGLVLDLSYHPIWADSMGVFPFRDPTPGKKVWMSRAKLPQDFGHVSQEDEIEDQLISQGWKIVHPHLMTNTELLYFTSDAETISGFAASAYFYLLLSRNCRAKIRMVDRGGMGIPPAFVHYAIAKNLQQEILRPKMESVSGLGAKATYRLERIDEVLEFVNG